VGPNRGELVNRLPNFGDTPCLGWLIPLSDREAVDRRCEFGLIRLKCRVMAIPRLPTIGDRARGIVLRKMLAGRFKVLYNVVETNDSRRPEFDEEPPAKPELLERAKLLGLGNLLHVVGRRRAELVVRRRRAAIPETDLH
jgi:hypothetical protein